MGPAIAFSVTVVAAVVLRDIAFCRAPSGAGSDGGKAQRRALRELSPIWGIKVAYREIIDLPAVFGRPPLAALLELPLHVVLDIGFGTGESLLEMARSAPCTLFWKA